MIKLEHYKRMGRSRVTAPPPAAKGLASMPSQSTCSIPDCERPTLARGWCSMHWQRWKRHGDPLAIVMQFPNGRHLTLEQRFWEKVQRSDGCWSWIGARDSDGYGYLRVGPRNEMSHRVSWELHNGTIPDGMGVLHRCDNPPCVRPDHLFLGTKADNNADKAAKLRAPQSKLTPDQVRTIRDLSRAGVSASWIAKEYGLHRKTVVALLRCETWQHVV